MKQQIQKQLEHLIGLPLSNTSVAADMECIKFGREIKEGVYEYALHVQCPWKVTQDSTTIALQSLIAQHPLITAVQAQDDGGCIISFEKNAELILQARPLDDPDDELWRLIDNTQGQSRHFVVPMDIMTQAYVAYEDGQYALAAKLVQQELSSVPENVEALILATRLLQQDNAIGYFPDELSQKNPLDLIEQALAIDPTNALAWNEKGMLLSHTPNNFKEAIECFDKAIELAYVPDEFFYNKSMCFLDNEHYPEAIVNFEEYLHRRQGDDQVYFHKAMAHAYMGEKTEALACLEKAFSKTEGDMLQQIAARHPAFQSLTDDSIFQRMVLR